MYPGAAATICRPWCVWSEPQHDRARSRARVWRVWRDQADYHRLRRPCMEKKTTETLYFSLTVVFVCRPASLVVLASSRSIRWRTPRRHAKSSTALFWMTALSASTFPTQRAHTHPPQVAIWATSTRASVAEWKRYMRPTAVAVGTPISQLFFS